MNQNDNNTKVEEVKAEGRVFTWSGVGLLHGCGMWSVVDADGNPMEFKVSSVNKANEAFRP